MIRFIMTRAGAQRVGKLVNDYLELEPTTLYVELKNKGKQPEKMILKHLQINKICNNDISHWSNVLKPQGDVIYTHCMKALLAF